MKKFMLIGAPISFGENIVSRFAAETFSKRNGYNINSKETRQELATKSLDYDVVIVHAYSRENGQFYTVQDIVTKWIEANHTGNIIVTGSIASYFDNYGKDVNGWEYAAQKTALDKFCKMVSKRCVLGEHKFKISVIKPGMMDTENSRKKSHFVKGLSGERFCDVIEFLVNLPDDVIIPEIPIETVYDN
jgi:NAD(P)-dependent dehydrogenase (short-subunit alcohol dehydrogenase family)